MINPILKSKTPPPPPHQICCKNFIQLLDFSQVVPALFDLDQGRIQNSLAKISPSSDSPYKK